MSKLRVSAIHDPFNNNEALTIDTSGNVGITNALTMSTLTVTNGLSVGSLSVGGATINSTGAAEVIYLDGVTSNVQTQLDGKQSTLVAGTDYLTPTGDGSSLTGINTDLVSDTTPQLGGDLASNGNDIRFADGDKARFGAGSDLQIYHTGTASFIREAGTGDLYITGSNILITDSVGYEFINCIDNGLGGTVILKHDNSTVLTTTSTGIDVTGGIDLDGNITLGDNQKAIFGTDNDLQIYHDGNHSYISDTGTGNLRLKSSTKTQIYNSAGSEYVAQFDETNGCYLYTNGSLKLATTSTGVDVTGTVSATSFTGDGSSLTGIDALPDQTGHSGQYLTTDGTNASWTTVAQQLSTPSLNTPDDNFVETDVTYTASGLTTTVEGTKTVTFVTTDTSASLTSVSAGTATGGDFSSGTLTITGIPQSTSSVNIVMRFSAEGTYTQKVKYSTPSDSNYSESNYTSTDSITVEAVRTSDAFQILGDSSCIAQYRFDNNLNDTGGSYNASNVNNWTYSSTDLMYDSYSGVSSGSAWGLAGFNVSNTYSVSVWVKGEGQICMNRVLGSYGHRTIDFTTSRLKTYNGSSDSYLYYTSPSTDDWHHIVVTRSGSTAYVYVDGSQVASSTSMGTTNTGNSGMYIASGYNPDGGYGSTPDQYFNGKMDQLRFFNKAVSSSEVTTLYEEGA